MSHTHIFHSSDEQGEVSAQPHQVNLENVSVCKDSKMLLNVQQCFINICFFQHIILTGI